MAAGNPARLFKRFALWKLGNFTKASRPCGIFRGSIQKIRYPSRTHPLTRASPQSSTKDGMSRIPTMERKSEEGPQDCCCWQFAHVAILGNKLEVSQRHDHHADSRLHVPALLFKVHNTKTTKRDLQTQAISSRPHRWLHQRCW